MGLLRRRCTSRNQKVLRHSIRSLITHTQVSVVWYQKITLCFVHQDRQLSHWFSFTKSEADENLYHILVVGKFIIIFLYVDDLILTRDEQFIRSCKEDLSREFQMNDMGLMYYFIRLEVFQGDGEIFVSQGKYTNEILHRFHMEISKPMDTPLANNWRKEDSTSGEEVEATIYQKLVGSLMYIMSTIPNMCYEVHHIRQDMFRITILYCRASKHVLWCLRGTTTCGSWYRRTKGVNLCGFIDADWVGIPLVHQVEFSMLVSQLFPGTTRSKEMWCSPWQKKNRWLQFK